MTSVLRRPLVAASLALFAVLLVLLILSAVRVHQTSNSVDRQSREAMNWIASQMEVEFWRFTQASIVMSLPNRRHRLAAFRYAWTFCGAEFGSSNQATSA